MCIIRILRALKDSRIVLSENYQNPDRKAWRNAWNSTIDLARAFDVLDIIPEKILKLQK